ncbi:FkbM family methyltransferase, partial [Hansschlegelia quercus]
TLFVQTPRNDDAIATFGPYRRHLNALTGRGTNIQRRLSRGGLANYEPDLQAALLALAQSPRQRVFFDVGAHIGFFAGLLSAVYRGNGLQTYAFEPTPSTFGRALKFRDKNAFGYMLTPCAVSNEPGETQLFLSTKAETSNSLNAGFRPGSTAVTVRCETIDGLVAAGAPPPTLMKIDVETFEPQVILGARATITRSKPWITCEFLSGTDDALLDQALSFLEEQGYGFYQIVREGPWERLDKSGVIARRSSAAGSRDWLVAPKPPSHAFYTRYAAWRTAIDECGASSNMTVDDKATRKRLTAR